MATTGTRRTAEERREEILEAALGEFACSGLHGASTDAIARAAGLSQPYLFRLFGTKKGLFLAVVERCLDETYELFRRSAHGLHGEEALHAIGNAYEELLREQPMRLRAQMQGYAACDDPDVRETMRRGYGRLVEFAEAVGGKDANELSSFFAAGMLLNVITMMGLFERPTPWGDRLIEGCEKQKPEA
jgi:AcrR family transcriptional regulator